MNVWNNLSTPADVLAHVGRIDQAGQVLPFEFTDGPERGTRGLLLENGAGLRLMIHPDRCLDISAASYEGVALAWLSSSGFAAPGFYEPQNQGWLRTFGGGLIATCGLTNAGPPTDDKYGHTGQHGRIGTTPASHVASGGRWDGGTYTLYVTGQMRETRLFAENLRLDRTLTVPLAEPRLTVTDRVTNEGDQPAPLMLLYHCNFGFPLLSAAARLEGDFVSVTPRDAEAVEGQAQALTFVPPRAGYREKVYWLDPRADEQGWAGVALVNPELGLAARLRYDKAALPCLTEWKQMGQGSYTVGLEPGNVLPLGRASYLEQGKLPMLAPGETERFEFEISVERLARG